MSAFTTDCPHTTTCPQENDNCSEVKKEFNTTVSHPQSHLGGKRTQQDCGFSIQTDQYSMAAVFDGHGADGFSNAAMAAAQSIINRPKFYEKLLETPQKTAEILFAAMQRSNFEESLKILEKKGTSYKVENGNIYCTNVRRLRGGTTASLVFADKTGLITSLNVGDSDAWLFSDSDATKLTTDHIPESPEEYDRLMSFKKDGFTTECVYDCPPSMLPRGSLVIPRAAVHGDEPLTPYYHCNRNKKPATLVKVSGPRGTHKLAMTRSIGDENLRKGGIISVPSVRQIQAQESSIIKIASDGYWDAIATSEEMSSSSEAIMRHGYDANKLCEEWFKTTKAVSDREFNGVGDNMWGYIITVESN
jgi:serine/threonine protein phosphatase PrpC